LTNHRILEKEEQMRAKKANRRSEAEFWEAQYRRVMNRALVETAADMLLIPQSAKVLANHTG
jgi:hypothetical protein